MEEDKKGNLNATNGGGMKEEYDDKMNANLTSRKRQKPSSTEKVPVKIFSLRKYNSQGKKSYIQMIIMLSYLAKMREAKSFFSQRELFYAMRGIGYSLSSLPSILSSSSSCDSFSTGFGKEAKRTYKNLHFRFPNMKNNRLTSDILVPSNHNILSASTATKSFFPNQGVCDEMILDCTFFLGKINKTETGILASSKGLLSGNLSFFNPSIQRYIDCHHTISSETKGVSITNIFTEAIAQTIDLQIESSAKCILVIEKETIFSRLLIDKFTELYPSILITGRGVPDLATQACVKYLSLKLPNIPIYGLADCNPFGLALLLCYKVGAYRQGYGAGSYAVNLKWLGLRPSQVKKVCNLPYSVSQALSRFDREKVDSLLNQHPFIMVNKEYQEELKLMSEMGQKYELEALTANGINYLSTEFLLNCLLTRDYI